METHGYKCLTVELIVATVRVDTIQLLLMRQTMSQLAMHMWVPGPILAYEKLVNFALDLDGC